MGLSNTRDTAAFNLALPFLSRVNGILNSNYTEFKNGNAGGFAVNLKQLYREIESWLIRDEKIDEKTPIEVLFKELAAIPKFKKDGKTPNKDLIWNKMEEIELVLRRHFKELGMLMPKVNDPRFLFGNKQK
jgi:hypothetical protein